MQAYRGFESLPLRQHCEKSNSIYRSLIVIGFFAVRLVRAGGMRRHFRWSCLKRTGYCCFRSASRTTFERCVGTREERLSVRRPEPRSVRTRICRDRRAFGKLAVRTTSLTPYEITREAGAIGDSVSGNSTRIRIRPLRETSKSVQSSGPKPMLHMPTS